MSDETKGANTVTNGCDHSELVPRDELPTNLGRDIEICAKCSVVICGTVWRRLHPPPEPPKSWVERTADRSIDPVAFAAFARETVEECRRALNAVGYPGAAEYLRRAMLEPKA